MKIFSVEQDHTGRRPFRLSRRKSRSSCEDDELSVYSGSQTEALLRHNPSNFEVLAPENEDQLRKLVETQQWVYRREDEDEISVKYHWESPRSRKRTQSSSPDSSSVGDSSAGMVFRDENFAGEEGTEKEHLLKEHRQKSTSLTEALSEDDRGVLEPKPQNSGGMLRLNWLSGESANKSMKEKDSRGHNEEFSGLLDDFDESVSDRHLAFDVEQFEEDDDELVFSIDDMSMWLLESDEDNLLPPPPTHSSRYTKKEPTLDMEPFTLSSSELDTDTFLPVGGAFSKRCYHASAISSRRSANYSMTRSRFMPRRKKKQRTNPWDRTFATGRDFQTELETVKEEDEQENITKIPNSGFSWDRDEFKVTLLRKPNPLKAVNQKKRRKERRSKLKSWVKKQYNKTTDGWEDDESVNVDDKSANSVEFVELEDSPGIFSTSFECAYSGWDDAVEAFQSLSLGGQSSAFAPYGSIPVTPEQECEI